jgi:hypothetical protein
MIREETSELSVFEICDRLAQLGECWAANSRMLGESELHLAILNKIIADRLLSIKIEKGNYLWFVSLTAQRFNQDTTRTSFHCEANSQSLTAALFQSYLIYQVWRTPRKEMSDTHGD